MTPELVSRFVTLALMQAHVAAIEMEENVIPMLPPARRAFATKLARRIDQGSIFEDGFLRDLRAFDAILDDRIRNGTQSYWHSDECHVDGGYELIRCDRGIAELIHAADELDFLENTVCAVVSASRALRETGKLLDS
jgi:hypothetical protein